MLAGLGVGFLLTLLCSGAVLLGGVAFWPTGLLAEWAAGFRRGPGPNPLGEADIRLIQKRALGVLLLLLVLIPAVAAAGARPAARIASDFRPTLDCLVAPLLRRQIAVPVTLLTVALACRLFFQLDHVLRTDEATSYLNHGLTSPLVTLTLWRDTNNHLLHSLLLWCSVTAFGDDPWAIRLPAAVATLTLVPAVFLAGRAAFGRTTGLLAAALFAGSGYALDMGTNARGYPLVLLAACVCVALLPRLRERRPAAMAIAAVASALGAWAVPVMILPFSGVVAALVLLPPRQRPRGAAGARSGLLPACLTAAVLARSTAALTLLLYLPPLLTAGLGGSSATGRTRAHVAATPWLERPVVLGRNLAHAWEQMTFPAPGFLQAVLAVAVVAGIAQILLRGSGGVGRAWVAGSLVGPAALLAVLGIPPLPVWTLGFAFPLALCVLAESGRRAVCWLGSRAATPRRSGGLPGFSVVAAGLCFGVAATTTGIADHARNFPWMVGYRDAPAAAAVLASLPADRFAVQAGLIRAPIVEYYLRRHAAAEGRTLPPGVRVLEKGVSPASAEGLVWIRKPLDAGAETGWKHESFAAEPVRRWRLPHSVVSLHERLPAAAAARGS